MDDHAGRVEHAPEARPARAVELLAQARAQVAGIGPGANVLARLIEHTPRGVDGERIVYRARELVDGRKIAKTHAASVGKRQEGPPERALRRPVCSKPYLK
jgi:hypothetical protein